MRFGRLILSGRVHAFRDELFLGGEGSGNVEAGDEVGRAGRALPEDERHEAYALTCELFPLTRDGAVEPRLLGVHSVPLGGLGVVHHVTVTVGSQRGTLAVYFLSNCHSIFQSLVIKTGSLEMGRTPRCCNSGSRRGTLAVYFLFSVELSQYLSLTGDQNRNS